MRDKLDVANIEIHKWNEYDSSDNGCTRARKSKGASCVESRERLLERVTFRRIIEYRRKGGALEGRGESRDNWQDKLGD